MTSWHLTIPRPAGWLNLNDRMHYRAHAVNVRAWRDAARMYALQAKLPRGVARVRIEAWLRFPDRRRRDVHNWMPTVKPIVDGLVDYGLIADDRDEYLIGPDLRRGEPHQPGAVVLVIEEAP